MASQMGNPGIPSDPEEFDRVYRALFDASHEVIVVHDERDRIVDINPRAVQITGYSVGELCGMSAPRDLAVPEDAEKLRNILQDVRNGSVREYDIRWRTKDSRIVEFDVVTVPLVLPGNKAVWTFCSLRDMTERNAADRQVRASRERLQQILATLPVGLAVTDRTGDIELVNAAFNRIWGGEAIVSGAERRARSKGYWHGNGQRIADSDWASVKALREGRTILNELIDIEAFDGVRKTIQNSAAPMRDEHGEIASAIIINEDVTERVNAERELRAALDELQALSAKLVEVQETERQGLSRELHDRIGQNLTALNLNLEALSGRLQGSGSEIISRLQDSRQLLDATFDATLDLLSELRPPMLDDAGLLSALRWYGKQFSGRTGLEVFVVGGDPGERLDPARQIVLFRIAQEALNNVAKHARAKRVEIALSTENGESTLSILDDGVGVDRERTSGPGAHVGLGMVTMRERARALGGSLEVVPRHEGGTAVVVRAPQRPGT
jgi:PAS domain S-box-containing protein